MDGNITNVVCCVEFRRAGFTGAACNFPLTPEGAAIVAEHNGLTVEQIPPAWHYAPNAFMRDWLNDLGARKARGEVVRINGRWVR